MKRKPKIGDTAIFFGIKFTYTGSCWTNVYIPKKDGLQKK